MLLLQYHLCRLCITVCSPNTNFTCAWHTGASCAAHLFKPLSTLLFLGGSVDNCTCSACKICRLMTWSSNYDNYNIITSSDGDNQNLREKMCTNAKSFQIGIWTPQTKKRLTNTEAQNFAVEKSSGMFDSRQQNTNSVVAEQGFFFFVGSSLKYFKYSRWSKTFLIPRRNPLTDTHLHFTWMNRSS